jgi:NAD-dependent deacetylase
MLESKLKRASEIIWHADRILVFAGSGLSQESGIPTFRGEEGIYSDDKLLEFAHVDALEEKPEQALKWYQQFREQFDEYEPNPGHYALARLARRGETLVATQNVDGLLQKAFRREGVSPNIWNLHGTLDRIVCHKCGEVIEHPPDDLSKDYEHECGGVLRPDVVLFGEMLPEKPFKQSLAAAERADVVLMLGTSGLVYPAASIPTLARSHGAKLIEVNPNETELSDIAEVTLRGKTGELLPTLDRLVHKRT